MRHQRRRMGDAIEGFQLKRVRSGEETLLAANRISREIRGHVLSHDLTGIQARHCDGRDYLPEKRRALGVLAREVSDSAVRPKTVNRAGDPLPLAPTRIQGATSKGGARFPIRCDRRHDVVDWRCPFRERSSLGQDTHRTVRGTFTTGRNGPARR